MPGLLLLFIQTAEDKNEGVGASIGVWSDLELLHGCWLGSSKVGSSKECSSRSINFGRSRITNHDVTSQALCEL